ncbi:MAG: hypothetical protein WCB31_03770 [Nitrososphaeraceae archaeon]
MDLPYNIKVMKKACGLSIVPNGRTFDRRLGTVSEDIKNRNTMIGGLFVHDNLTDSYIVTTEYSYQG